MKRIARQPNRDSRRSAAGEHPDDVDFGPPLDRCSDVAHLLFAEEYIHMRPDLPLLIHNTETDPGEAAVERRNRFPDGGRLDVDDPQAARIRMKQCSDSNAHCSHQSRRAAVTDMIFGRPVARLRQESPSSALPHTSPDVVPKARSIDAPPLCAIACRSTVCQARAGKPRSSRCHDSPPSRLRNTAGLPLTLVRGQTVPPSIGTTQMVLSSLGWHVIGKPMSPTSFGMLLPMRFHRCGLLPSCQSSL